MLNHLKSNPEITSQIRKLFLWFMEETATLWGDYDQRLYDASEEESKRLEELQAKRRKRLVQEGIDSFPNKDYLPLVEDLLNTLDHNSERARSFYLYPNYHLESIDAYLDCFATIGAHSFIDTIIIDSLEDVDRDVILEKYKSELDKQADALFAEEEDVEMVWDNVYFINVSGDVRLHHFSELIEHTRP